MAKILNASIDTTLGGENASNEVISSQKAIKTYVDNKTGNLNALVTTSKSNLVSAVNEVVDTFSNLSYAVSSPALTPSEGVCTWQITHNLGTQDIICTLYDSGVEITKNTTLDSDNAITVTFNAIEAISAGAIRAVIFATGALGGGSSTSDNNDMVLQMLNDTISGEYEALPTTYSSVASSLDTIIEG